MTGDDEEALRKAAEILGGHADDMVTAYRARLGQQPWLAGDSGHPDGTDSLDHIPMRNLLSFTAVVITTAWLPGGQRCLPKQVSRMHAAFTKAVMLHVTVRTRAYVDDVAIPAGPRPYWWS